MELRELRVAVAIAEHGSVTRAAAALHQSTSAVSHALLALESQLGVSLFHRLPRGMALTDAGELFLDAARRALHAAEVARRSVDAVRGVVAGRVTVAPGLGFAVALADLVGEFTRRHPHVVVRVLPPEPPDGVADLVRTGRSDVGITWGGAQQADLDAAPVLADPGVVVVPAGHRLAGRHTVSVRDLQGERLVAPVATSTMRIAFEALLAEHGVVADLVAEAATDEMVLELVRAGVGCTVTFASSAALVEGRGAVALRLDDHVPNTFLILTRARQELTPAARAFAEVATTFF